MNDKRKKKRYQLFRQYYLFQYDAESTAGMYFMFCVTLYLVFGKISSGIDITLDLWTAVEMLLCCIIIGFTQRLFVTENKITLQRSVIWIILSSGVSIGASWLWGWFEEFPVWCPVVFHVLFCIGCTLLCLNIAWRAARENERLNDHLKDYQETFFNS